MRRSAHAGAGVSCGNDSEGSRMTGVTRMLETAMSPLRTLAGREISQDQRQELRPYCVGDSLSIQIRAKIGPGARFCAPSPAQTGDPTPPSDRRQQCSASAPRRAFCRSFFLISISTLDWRSAIGVALSRVAFDEG